MATASSVASAATAVGPLFGWQRVHAAWVATPVSIRMHASADGAGRREVGHDPVADDDRLLGVAPTAWPPLP